MVGTKIDDKVMKDRSSKVNLCIGDDPPRGKGLKTVELLYEKPLDKT